GGLLRPPRSPLFPYTTLFRSLLRADAQRALLDTYCGGRELAREVADLHHKWRRLSELRAEAERDAEASSRQRELLDWQIAELERSEEHTSELQSRENLVCRLL